MLSQVDETEAVLRTTRAQPAMDVDITHDGRWVYPQRYDWGRVVDDIDLLQTNITPQGVYVQSAVSAFKRKLDDQFLGAFFGTAQTGETGGTSTVFDTNNVVAVTEGAGSATGLNITKMEAALQILLDNDVDVEMETPIMAVTPKLHRDLKELTQVTSADFNTRKVLGEDGFVKHFNGFDIIVSTRLTTDSNGYVRSPVWVPSGMGKGLWQDIKGEIRNRPDLQSNPQYVEASMMAGFTRLEEAKCVEIKSTAS
jgi:hypothetical protein